MNFFRFFLGPERRQEEEINELRKRLEESEIKVEKLLEMVNILAAFDEKLSKDLRTVASHIALMEMSMMNKQKQGLVSLKRKSNDDDIIN